MEKELNYIKNYLLYGLWIAEWSAVMKPNIQTNLH